MDAILSLGMGYAIGCLSPAAFVAKKKNVDLKTEGTKNLGATNTALVLGRYAGYFVLFFDVLKSYISYKLARSGKGLASFGGLVLAHDVRIFGFLLILGFAMAFALNYGVYLAVTATTLFPVCCFLVHGDVMDALFCAIAGGFILVMHLPNLKRAITREDPIRMRDGFHKIFGEKK